MGCVFWKACGRKDQQGRFVALAAPRLGGQIGGVGFQEQPRGIKAGHGLGQGGILAIGHRAGDGEVKAAPGDFPGQGNVAAKAVPYQRPAGKAQVIQNSQGVGSGVAAVDDRRQPQFPGQGELVAKKPFLGLGRGRVPVVVEPDLAHGL